MPETFDLELDDGNVIQFDHEPTDSEIQSVMAEITKVPGVAEMAASGLPTLAKQHILPSMPKPGAAMVTSLPMVSAFEDLGNKVKDSALSSFKNLADSPLPSLGKLQAPVEAARQGVKMLGETAIQAAPFTPTGFEQMGSAELFPMHVTPTKGINPKYAKATMEDAIPSMPDEIRNVERINTFGKEAKTTAEKVLDRPWLGNSRDTIKKKAQEQIQKIQGEIQSGIDSAENVKVSKYEFSKVYDQALDELKGVPNAGKDVRLIEKLKKEFLNDPNIPENQSLHKWDLTRKKLNERVGHRGYVLEKPTIHVDIDRSFAGKIRDILADKIPGIKKLRREQGDLMEIRDSIIRSSPKEVRDPRLWGPVLEEMAIGGSRFLSKKRKDPSGVGIGMSLPILAEDRP